jgi:hypothetical protein
MSLLMLGTDIDSFTSSQLLGILRAAHCVTWYSCIVKSMGRQGNDCREDEEKFMLLALPSVS